MFWIQASTLTSLKKDLLESAFFILSGFIIAYNYEEKLLEKITTKRTFLGSTHCPHLPPPSTYSINCRMYRRVCSIQRYDRLDKTLRRFHFLLQPFFPSADYFFSFNSPSWSLGCEQLFYFCFPLIIPFLNSKRNLCITLFICLLVMLTGMHLTAEEQIKAYWYVNPITRLPDFFVGVLLYQFYRSIFNKRLLIPPEHY